MNWRKLWLFIRIVWRPCVDDHIMDFQLAWQVAGIIWPTADLMCGVNEED
jgi:hypothetical protein